MTAYDGSIRIDSRIDARGFNQGIKGMLTALKPLALAVAAVFGVRAIVNFGKSAVDEASKMASALIGLQSIVEGTGNSFAGAQKFINEFIADGLVPAQNAVTAYKNLLARGYDTSQIEKTLIALKNSAAFGRQSSLTLGQAVQSASEGLKNENSILVDNAGVTKNVSIMWKEYAASIGTSVGALTKQQKIQAEVAGIMEETRFQMGDAAKLANTYSGQVSALGVSFTNLKVAVGNSIIPIIQTILPYIRAAVDALTVFFNRVATIMSLLFGVDMAANTAAAEAGMGGVADNTQDAADAQGELADNTEKAGKAAKGALASFDDLNVLAQDTGDGAGGADAGGIGAGVEIPALDMTPVDESLETLKVKIEEWRQGFLDFVEPLTTAIRDDLLPVLRELGGKVWDGLVWIWENILKPFGAWFVKEFLPIFVSLMAEELELLGKVIETLGPIFSWLWENVLKPIFAWLGDVAIAAMEWLIERLKELNAWIDDNQELWGVMATVLLVVAGIVVGVLAGGLTAVIALIAGIIYIMANWRSAWDILVGVIGEAWKTVTLLWGMASQWFQQNVFDPIKNGFQSAFEAVVGFVKGAINRVIYYINGMIAGIVNGINKVIYAANVVSAVLPGSPQVGYVSASYIPYLAKGAVIPPNAQFLAMLGDNKRENEILAPESTIRRILQEELGGVQSEVTINFSGSLGSLVRELRPYIEKENTRIGGSLIRSGVTR